LNYSFNTFLIVYFSHNIIRFLAYQFPVSANWYPEEFSIRSQIDTYLDW